MAARNVIFGTLLALGTTSIAQANMKGSFFIPELPVNAVSATEFEVLEGPSEGAKTYWCAAAFYATFELGRETGRIYLTEPFGPAQTAGNTRGVTFSLTAPAQTSNPVTLSIEDAGATYSIGHAIQFCRDSDLEADR